MINLLGTGELDVIGVLRRGGKEVVHMEGVQRQVEGELGNEHRRRSGGVLVVVASVRSTCPVCIDDL